MKIFVATKETQGQKEGDFSWTEEGEMVTLPAMCDRIDTCGCDRSMSGLRSHKATTTFKVIETPMQRQSYVVAILRGLVEGGWYKKPDDPKAVEQAKSDAQELMRLASTFPVGTVLEKTRTAVQIRQDAKPKVKGPMEIAREALALVEEAGNIHCRYTAKESSLLGKAQDALTKYVNKKGR